MPPANSDIHTQLWYYNMMFSFNRNVRSLTSTVLPDRKCFALGLLWGLTGLFVSLYCCVSVARQDVRSIWTGGGKPVILTYLLWFQSPHIPTYTFTHPVPEAAAEVVAAVLRMGVFHSKTPVVIFSSTSHSIYNKVCTSRKGGYVRLICLIQVGLDFVSLTSISCKTGNISISNILTNRKKNVYYETFFVWMSFCAKFLGLTAYPIYWKESWQDKTSLFQQLFVKAWHVSDLLS